MMPLPEHVGHQVGWRPLSPSRFLGVAHRPLRQHKRRSISTPLVKCSAAAAPVPEGAPAKEGYSREFVARRLLVFSGLLIGYTSFYLARGSLTFTAPVMLADSSLGLNLKDVGAMTSAFPVAYGLSKFFSGILGARFSPRLLLGLALMATGVVNILFGFSSSVFWWCTLWAMNGGLQGVAAPASASVITRWFASEERGTYWGLWNIGTNMGGFLAPIIVGTVAKRFGWQWGMFAPGLLGMVAGAILLATVRDKPEDAGFPAVEPIKLMSNGQEPARPSIRATVLSVLSSWQTWLLAVAYFFVYLLRQGSTSWLVFYLMACKGAADSAQAAVTVSGLELGGFMGSFLSGFLADLSIRSAKPNEGRVGKRVQIVILYTLATIGVLFALSQVPASAHGLQWLTIAALGFCIYGPQMLIGLCGAELASKDAVSASQGLLGLISYLGAANAGVPLAHVVETYGWNGYFFAMAGACCVTSLLLLPLVNAQSFVQRQSAAAAAGRAE